MKINNVIETNGFKKNMNANKIVNKILSTIIIIKKLSQFSKISVSTVKLAINLEEFLFI